MFRAVRFSSLSGFFLGMFFGVFVTGCSQDHAPSSPASPTGTAATPPIAVKSPTPPRETDQPFPVMLGIDVLEAEGFAAVKGKRIGLLTHPAGVNRRGEATIEVLRRAPQTQLVALFAPEHGLYGTELASVNFNDTTDRKTGLPVYSLHGDNRKPTEAQLKGLDALVIDLQDIGVRAYTFNVVARYAMDSCFLYGVEVIVLDRPNPLGGVKVDGPILEPAWNSGVGAYPIPYVHGLTLGELARFAAAQPGVLSVSEEVRAKGRLTVIPMRGWHREMLWPKTGLTYVPTSQYVRDFDGVIGFAMTGLGCEYSGFEHGLGTPHPFRFLSFKGQKPEQLESDLAALHVPGISFAKKTVSDAKGRPVTGVFVDVVDWEQWNPTELSFQMMRLACRYRPPNPFAKIKAEEVTLFNKHVGSTAWWNALRQDGAAVNVEFWLKTWKAKAAAYREQTRPYWLYD